MRFVKELANYIKYWYMFLILNHICPNNLPLWQSVTKPQQTNENMREVINHSTHIYLLNTIKSIQIQTLEKLCKKRVRGKKDFDNLYLWNTLNKTHQGILVWNRNNRLHTLNKKHLYKDRKETIHGKDRWITYINIYKPNISKMYLKWSQDQYTKK